VCEEDEQLREFQELAGYRFRDVSLLRRALTHASLNNGGCGSNERLEFLGDAVAGLVVAHWLFCLPQRHSEGKMSEIKSAVLSGRSMARAGHRVKLQRYLRVDRALGRKGDYPPSVIGNAYEALVGALFLDGGFEAARQFVLRTLEPELAAAEQQRHPLSHKSLLQQFVQAEGKQPPTYRTVESIGPPHDLRFMAVVYVQEQERGRGWGRTKKQAEQEAARQALETLYAGWKERIGAP